MLRFIARRLPSVAFLALASSVIAFTLPRLAPGDPAVALAGSAATAEQVKAIRNQVGLNKPLGQQYVDWISGLFHGDLGKSYVLQRPVVSVIGSRLESTLELAILATLIMLAIGLALGVLGGAPRPKWFRGILDAFDTLFLATPPFLTGLLLILSLGIAFPIFPISGEAGFLQDPIASIEYLVLPATALALPQAAVIARLLQTSMQTARHEEFVDLAVAKGVKPWAITRKHILRNSSGSTVVAIGLRVGELLGGAIVIEAIFARNGLGQLAVSSVQSRDYLVLQALILGAVLIAIFIQLLTEIVLSGLDPRIRLGA
jgi:peptide/nickel transport system permease protein